MRVGQDIAVRFPGLYLVHHNIPGQKEDWHDWAQHVLFIPLQGQIEILLRSGSLLGGPGKMLYVPPNTSLHFQASEASGERPARLLAHTRRRTGTSFQPGPTD